MLSPLLFGVLVFSRQAPKVSLELRGVRMENAAPILAKTLGLDSLAIGPSLINDVLLLRCKDVEASVLQEKIAKALNATWEHRPEGWRFSQSDEQKAAEKKVYDVGRYQYFTDLLEHSKKRLATLHPFDEAFCKQLLKQLEILSKTEVDPDDERIWQRIGRIDRESPASRLALRMTRRLTPDIFMKLTPENPRVVFCNHPNAVQQAMPFAIDDLLSLTIQEQTTWANNVTDEPLTGRFKGSGEDGGGLPLGNLNSTRTPFKSTDLSTITLTLELETLSIIVRAYDRTGHQTFETSFEMDSDDSSNEATPSYKEQLALERKKAVAVQGEAKEFLNLVNPLEPATSNRDHRDISASLVAKIIQPETIDPLSIAVPDVFLSSISTPNVAIALNEDRMSEWYVDLANDETVKVTNEGDWFICSHIDPISYRKRMPDRKKLGPLLRFIQKNQRALTLEEQAAFAFGLPWDENASWGYETFISMLKTNQVESGVDRMALRIYGSLSPAQRDLAKKSGVPLRQLSEETRRELIRSIYLSPRYSANLEMDDLDYEHMTPEQEKQISATQELIYGGIYQDPTFALPNGLSNDFVLKIQDTNLSTMYCGNGSTNNEFYGSTGMSMDTESLGRYLFMSKNPGRYGPMMDRYFQLDESNIRLASQRSIQIKLAINPTMHYTWSLSQTLTTDPKVYTTKTLPQKILDDIQKAYKETEEQDKQFGSFMDRSGWRTKGNKTPPPPR